MKHAPRFNVLGIGISVVDLLSTVQIARQWIEAGVSQYICLCNVYSVMSCQRDPVLRQAVNAAGLAAPDGMPLVWIGRLKGHTRIGRVYGPDFMLALCKETQSTGFRHFFYGGASGVAEAATLKLRKCYPGLQIAGTISPPFRPLTKPEDEEIVRQINASAPNVVWVSLGTPKQDQWAADHVGRIEGAVIVPVGAAFDFLTGRLPQAPRWMRKSGMEWFFRLLSEPRRLWRRYLIDNPIFVLLVLCQTLGLRRTPTE